MQDSDLPANGTHVPYNERFLEFIRLFARLDRNEKLFPKECRTCGRKFTSLSHYLTLTTAKGHQLEDCQEVMGRPFTMMYRHCACGNTLILTFTQEILPMLEEFWAMLQREAELTGAPFKEVVTNFSRQLDHYIITRHCSSITETDTESSEDSSMVESGE